MKKSFLIVPVFALLVFNSPVLAANTNTGSGAQGAGSSQVTPTQTQQQLQVSPPTTGNQVQNQNQVQTQNEGEADQIQTQNQEQEDLSVSQSNQGQGISEETSVLNETATRNVSTVSQKVEALLTTQTLSNDIGQQVKVIAQEQKIVQEQLQVELEKVDNRGGLLKSIIGPDFNALRSIQKQMDQNQLRIQKLEQLKTQLVNKGDIDKVQATIVAMVQQNVALQEQAISEEQARSLFGWLFKFFAI